LIEDWITPVPSSPEAMGRPAALSESNANGMPPVELKKLTRVLATFCWLMFRPPGKLGPGGGGTKFSVRFRKASLAS
jgi:hypothetical protein